MVGNEIDAVLEAMSEEEIDTFLEEIKAEPEMVQAALEQAVRVLTGFIGRNDLQDQFVSEAAPNEMIAVTVAIEVLTLSITSGFPENH